jgi:hypothetical protein
MPLYVKRTACIRNLTASVDGREAFASAPGEKRFLSALYRALGVEYPKFFKMDRLSKLGFLASELLLREEDNRFVAREDCAVICFNRSASLDSDRLYQASIRPGEEYFPSPSLFVYTLPNILTAEIAIRNKLYGETSFYICETFNAQQIFRTVSAAFAGGQIRSALAGWTEYEGQACEAFLMLIESRRGPAPGPPFSVDLIDSARLNQETRLRDAK